MKLIFAILIFCSSINILGQLILSKEGVKHFENASQLFQKGDFQGADSLFTLTLCSLKNENVYFNRAFARINIEDTLGYCSDLRIAANSYFDEQAAKLYNKDCCDNVDTTYYDRKFVSTEKGKHKYIEELQFPKYEQDKFGIIRRKGRKQEILHTDYNCEGGLIDVSFKHTDIIATYEFIDTVKYFYISPSKPSFRSSYIYDEIKSKHKQYYKVKYQYIKEQYNTDEIIIVFLLYINPKGEVEKVKSIYTAPEIVDPNYFNKLLEDIEEMASKIPKYKPAKFKGDAVHSIAFDYIKF